jgi:tetratricopeptide (TPR) repeat protein
VIRHYILVTFIIAICCAGCTKPPGKAEILAAGKKFYDEGDYKLAEKKFEQALKLYLEQDGATNANTCTTEMYLGNTQWELGKYSLALIQHKTALAALKTQYGNDSEQVADAQLRLGIDSYSLNDKKAAKSYYENSLAILKKHLPKTIAKVKQLQSKLKALASNK